MNSKQRRQAAKARLRSVERLPGVLGKHYVNGEAFEGDGYWSYDSRSFKESPKPDPEPKVPGVNVPPVDEAFNERVSMNKWFDIPELDEWIKTIKELSKEDATWSWGKNWDCKYINLRFDMRDGGFYVTNGEGERINLEQLKWQWRSLKDNVEGNKNEKEN